MGMWWKELTDEHEQKAAETIDVRTHTTKKRLALSTLSTLSAIALTMPPGPTVAPSHPLILSSSHPLILSSSHPPILPPSHVQHSVQSIQSTRTRTPYSIHTYSYTVLNSSYTMRILILVHVPFLRIWMTPRRRAYTMQRRSEERLKNRYARSGERRYQLPV